MRPQDEIVLALPRQDARGRRFLLRRLRELPLAVDAMELLSLARLVYAKEGSLAAWLTEESIWSRRERERLHRSVGEATGGAGAWTSFLSADDSQISSGPAAEAPDVAAGKALGPLLEPLEKGASRGREHLIFTMRVLGRVRSTASLELISRLIQKHQIVVPGMAAFATCGGPEAANRALALARAVERLPAFPSLLEAFSALPSPQTFDYLAKLASRGGEVAAGVVAAMEGFTDYDHLAVLDSTMSQGDPWVLIQGVETLGRIGTADHLKRVEVVFDANPHPLIQIACLQGVSGTTGELVLPLAQKGLASKNPAVQAAAIETLIAAQVPYNQFRDQVVALLGSPHPKLSLNALLACVAVDPQRAVNRCGQLLSSGVPTDLLQGIQCLAYIEAPSSIEALGRIVESLPPGAMRLQAVKSLGRLASRMPQAVAALGGVLESEDAKTREEAAWFLAGVHPAGREGATQMLAKACRDEFVTSTAIAEIEALGFLAKSATLAVPDLHYLLLVGPLQAEASARVLATCFPRSREAEDLATHGAASVEAYGGLLEWYEEGAGIERIYDALGAEDSFTYRAACEVARLAAHAGAMTAQTKRLTGLSVALGAQSLDGAEVSGLGLIERSMSIPRRKIGLGMVPRADNRTAQFAPAQLQVADPVMSASSPDSASQELDDVVMGASYYPGESGGAPDAVGEAIHAARTGTISAVEGSNPPASPGPVSGARPPPTPAPEKAGPPAAPAPVVPDAQGSTLSQAGFVVGLAVLCMITLYAGRMLRAWIG